MCVCCVEEENGYLTYMDLYHPFEIEELAGSYRRITVMLNQRSITNLAIRKCWKVEWHCEQRLTTFSKYEFWNYNTHYIYSHRTFWNVRTKSIGWRFSVMCGAVTGVEDRQVGFISCVLEENDEKEQVLHRRSLAVLTLIIRISLLFVAQCFRTPQTPFRVGMIYI